MSSDAGPGGSASSPNERPFILRPYVLTGVAVAAFGLYVIREAALLVPPSGYNPAGPELFPYIIGSATLGLGILLLIGELSGRSIDFTPVELSWGDIGCGFLALAVPIFFVESLGWVISCTLLFVIAARAFGSRRALLDALVGALLAVGTLVLFAYVLGLRLPGGILSNLIGIGS